MRAVGYVRVSTDEQAREGCSLDNQEARIRAYSDSQEWELVRIYREEGVSGKTMKRPRLCEMVQDIEGGKVDCVLVYRVDRLTRKQKDLWHLLEDVFEANGVGFKSVIEPFDTTTAQGKAFLGMLAVFAQLERDTIAERTRDALAMKIANGENVGAPAYGYRIEDGELVPIPEEQEILARIRKLRSGRRPKTYKDVAELLNQEGVPTKRGGGKWYPSTVRMVLRNGKQGLAAAREVKRSRA
jgi:site-specific DNA recombinase